MFYFSQSIATFIVLVLLVIFLSFFFFYGGCSQRWEAEGKEEINELVYSSCTRCMREGKDYMTSNTPTLIFKIFFLFLFT